MSQERTQLKIARIATTLATTVATSGAVCIVSAPISSADDAAAHTLGNQGRLVDGDIVQAWTISNLKTSTDTIPYPVRGTLWEATATNEALQGSVTPIVSNLNARARNGQTYRVLFQVATPQGVNPATLAQGQKATGKVYFDVTGDIPDRVVYNAGGQDLLAWVQPPPAHQAETTWTSPSGRSQVAPAPAAGPPTPAPAGTPATPATADTEVAPPAGPRGTPPTTGRQGTPVAASNEGTSVPAEPQEVPHLPAGAEVAPPMGSQGTPLPVDGQGIGSPVSAPTTTSVPAPAAPRPIDGPATEGPATEGPATGPTTTTSVPAPAA